MSLINVTDEEFQNTILEKLKPYYEVVSIDNHRFHKDIQEIHINKLTKTYTKDYWQSW